MLSDVLSGPPKVHKLALIEADSHKINKLNEAADIIHLTHVTCRYWSFLWSQVPVDCKAEPLTDQHLCWEPSNDPHSYRLLSHIPRSSCWKCRPGGGIYSVVQQTWERVPSLDVIWALMTDSVCLLIKWLTVEKCFYVCMCLYEGVRKRALGMFCRRECEIWHGRNPQLRLPSDSILAAKCAVWLITCTDVLFCRLMKKLGNSVTFPIVCFYIPTVLFHLA